MLKRVTSNQLSSKNRTSVRLSRFDKRTKIGGKPSPQFSNSEDVGFKLTNSEVAYRTLVNDDNLNLASTAQITWHLLQGFPTVNFTFDGTIPSMYVLIAKSPL